MGSALRTKTYYVYIMASRSLNLYTGITNCLYRRALQHKCGEIGGFTKRYKINRLVYYEIFHQIGKRHRSRKADQIVDSGKTDCVDSDKKSDLAGPGGRMG
jgi:predicted GIY-YIG superfamily endonuclease